MAPYKFYTFNNEKITDHCRADSEHFLYSLRTNGKSKNRNNS